MKTKSLLLAFAGLGLFACTNEDLNQGIEGVKNLKVSINLPVSPSDVMSRAIGEGIAPSDATTGNQGDKIPVEVNSIVVKLHANGQVYTKNYTKQTGDIDDFTPSVETDKSNKATLEFTAVRNATSIEVSVNSGNTTKLTLDALNSTDVKYAAPLYKSVPASEFNVGEDGNLSVTVTPSPRYARLELSGIARAALTGENPSMFTAATLGGMYLNAAVTEEGSENKTAATGWSENKPNPYDVPTWSLINQSFLTPSAKWPSEVNKAYAYNILEGMPKVIFALTNVTLETNASIIGWDGSSPLYAGISEYTTTATGEGISEGKITTFKPGFIYRITKIEIPDYAWGPDGENGGGEGKRLVATVTVEPWEIIDGEANW